VKTEILKKLFILDLVLGVILVGLGLYLENNILLIIGAISFIMGLINPNKRILDKIDKIKGKKKITS
jgi:hypothetical protein